MNRTTAGRHSTPSYDEGTILLLKRIVLVHDCFSPLGSIQSSLDFHTCRNDCLSSLRRITWFISGLIMVIQTAFKCAPIVLTRFRIGHRGTTPIGAKTARLDQCDLDTKWRDLA